MSFVLVDVWLLVFRKEINVISDLRRKYIFISDVSLVETHYFSLLFRFIVGIG